MFTGRKRRVSLDFGGNGVTASRAVVQRGPWHQCANCGENKIPQARKDFIEKENKKGKGYKPMTCLDCQRKTERLEVHCTPYHSDGTIVTSRQGLQDLDNGFGELD